MLKLASETPPAWAEGALAHLDEVLLDHAHCERKAAGTAVSLLFRHPEHAFLQEPLARLAREELAHFEEALRRLAERGVAFRRQRPSPYAGKLKRHVRDREPGRLVDTLLVCALIEARSCERLGLLAEAAAAREPALAAWYRGLLAAEARHHGVYVTLAAALAPRGDVEARLAELALAEAAILAEPPLFPQLPRLHTGPDEQARRPNVEIVTERVEIPVEGARMAGFLAKPAEGGPHPAVVVYMEIFGINAHIRDVAERVAREGYVALAPDYFHRTGPGIELGYDDAGMAEGMKHLNQLRADQMIADARATLAFLRARDDVRGEKIGAMGFCIGGHMTYLTACETDVAAAASFYGGGIAAPQGPGGAPSTVSRTPKIGGRILCLFGADDALIPQEQVQTIQQALEDAGVDHEVVVYDGANHGFFCDQRATYQERAAEDAWRRVKALFAEALAQGG